MKRSLALAAAALAAVTLVAAGCGGADEVPADAVAVVDGTPITRSSLDGLLTRAKKSYAAQKRDFPKAGTSDYQSLQTQAVAYLVQREEYAREADKLGIDVTDQQIAKKVDEVKKQYFGDSQAKFDKGLADQGYTKATLEDDIRSQLLTEGIYKKVTTDAKVTDADVKSYYEKNRANYTVPESRSVRHILVKSKADADRIRTELVNGGDFAALAKANSIDPGSKDAGGKLTVSKGQTVAPFDKTAFLLKKNAISKPVKTEFGYHIIQPLSETKPAKVTPLKEVRASIKQQLEQTQKNEAMTKWVDDLKKDYKDKVAYATGFTPPPDAKNTTSGTQ